MQYCVRQLFCTSAVKNPATQIHSLRRDSLFYVKKMQTVPGSMLLGIYRRYLKESLRVYKRLDGAIGEYLFGFLELRKTDIRRRLKTKRDTQEFLQGMRASINHNYGEQNDTNQNISQTNIKTSQIQSSLIKSQIQTERLNRVFTEHLLETAQQLHYFSQAISQCLNTQLDLDIRTKQQSKLLKLCTNTSEYFTPSLSVRKEYHSLTLLECLEDDMQFQILGDKDKEFVKNVVEKVCGEKRRNHSRFVRAGDYLKDPNAVLYETKTERLSIKNFKTELLSREEKLSENNEAQEQDDMHDPQDQTVQNSTTNDQWSIMSEKERNQMIKSILKSTETKQSISLAQPNHNHKYLLKTSSRSFLLSLMTNLNVPLKCQPQPQLRQQLYRLIKRLFKLESDVGCLLENGSQEKKSSFKSLEDVIAENEFLDEVVNQKRVIIV